MDERKEIWYIAAPCMMYLIAARMGKDVRLNVVDVGSCSGEQMVVLDQD